MARESERTGVPADELLEHAGGVPRREFLRKALRTGVGIAALPALSGLAAACTPKSGGSGTTSAPRPSTGSAQIAIVGAGLAGMTAAYRLTNAGHSVAVYDAADYIGGRTLTLQNYFDIPVEQGGNWINSDHTGMIKLIKELGLELTNLNAQYPSGLTGLYWFDGKPYDRQTVYKDFLQIYPQLRRDLKAARYPTTYDHKTRAGVRLDNISITDWIDKYVPGGSKSRFGQLLEVGYTGEYGLDPGIQPALNLIYEIAYSPENHIEIYGPQDYKYRVKGGNQLVTTTIGEKLPKGTVRLQSPLVAVRKNSSGSYTLTFQPPGQSAADVTADRVILALPFTTLRNTDFSNAGFDALKTKTINEIGMGTNSKIYMQFNERVWEKRGWTGDMVTNMPMEESDIVYPAAPGPGGVLLNYTGGSAGAGYDVPAAQSHAPAPEADVAKVLSQLDSVQPGFTPAYDGKAWLAFWKAYPWTLGSYSCPTIGQTSSIWGVARIPSGNCFFAGEHTQINDYGFMTGAVDSGNRAAAELLKSL